MTNYQYQALERDSDEIRLLRVHPAGSGCTPDELLIRDLQVVKLGDCPEYAALSYTWEPEDCTETVLNGEPLWIRKNLDFVLRSCRATSWQLLWADAICIDQANSEERSQQVEMMYQNLLVSETCIHLLSRRWMKQCGGDEHDVSK